MSGVAALQFGGASVLFAVATAVIAARRRLSCVVVARLVRIEFAPPDREDQDDDGGAI